MRIIEFRGAWRGKGIPKSGGNDPLCDGSPLSLQIIAGSNKLVDDLITVL